MKVKPLCLTFVAVSYAISLPAGAERIQLANNDLITSAITAIKQDTIYLDSPLLGKIKLPVSAIKSVQFEGSYWLKTKGDDDFQLVSFQKEDNKFYLLNPATKPDESPNLYKIIALQRQRPAGVKKPVVRPPPEPVEAPENRVQAQVVTQNITAEALQKVPVNQWLFSSTLSGYVNFSDIGNQSNDKTTLSVSGAHQARNTRNRHTLNWELSNETGTTYSNEKYILSYNYNYFLTEQFYLVTDTGYHQDDTASPYRLTSLNAGVGYQVYDSVERSLLVEGGPGFAMEDFRSQKDVSSPSMYFKLVYNQKLTDRLSLYDETKFNKRLNNNYSMILTGKFGVKYQVRESLWLELAHNYNWTNQPDVGFDSYTGNVNFGVGLGW